MTKNTLKELKKEYKKARLFQESTSVDAIEQQLRQELSEDAWQVFVADVEVFLEKVQSLASEVATKAKDQHEIMVEPALTPYLERAKALGGGAQKYIKMVFYKAVCDREAIRAADRAAFANTSHEADLIIYPCLPRDWAPENRLEYGEPIASKLGAVMYSYCSVSLRSDSQTKAELLRDIVARAKEVAKDSNAFDDAMATANYWLDFAIPVAREAERRMTDMPEQSEAIEKLGYPLKGYVMHKREAKKRNRKSKESRSAHEVSINAVAPVTEQSPHPNDITNLSPGKNWTVYLDESYYGDENAFESGGDGIMAGVICRDDTPLKPLPDLHCAQDATEERLVAQDRALEDVLHHPNCGVLAIPSNAYDAAMGWDDVLACWVDVVIRLLPFPDGNETVSMRICVEPHDPYRTTQDFRALKLVCEKSLKDSFPDRAKRVRLSFEAMPKPKEGELSCNAYPDIVGFTCLRHSGDNTARQRYEASGWRGFCHLDLPSHRLARLLRCSYQREPLDAKSWSALVASADTGIIGALSNRFGERAVASVEEWCRYLDYLRAHLLSGSIDMKLLRRQVSWLHRFRPALLPKLSQLTWLTAQISLANHEGKLAAGAGSQLRADFDALCAELYDESAPLVCDATLNLAVAYTNAYEFEMALSLLQSLLGKDRATVGLSCYGKLLSSEGQHLAFLGLVDKAIAKFNDALDCFARLADEKERSVNIDITRAYLATATMDGRPMDACSALSLYLLGDANAPIETLVCEAERIAAERRAKFHHHILLRYVVSMPEDDPLRKAYCGVKTKWCSPSAGHPWELIEFYRAQLLPSGEERARRLDTAFRIAEVEGGETLMVIAAVIAGAALADGLEGEWPERFARMVEGVKDMPGLRTEGRYQALLDQPQAKHPPLELAAKVLPFNFR